MHKKRPGRGPAQPSGRAAPILAILAVLGSGGCTAPAVEGYQLQAPPEGFLYTVQQGLSGSLIPGRSSQGGGVWMGDIRLDEPMSWFEVARYRGGATEADATAAREARAQVLRGSPYNRLGPLRPLARRDGSSAWAWTEERHDEYGRFRSLQVTGVISYDTVSFALELDTSVPERMTEAHLDSILATFAEGRTTVNWVLLGALGLVVGVMAALLGRRSSRGQHTDYRLARPPRPKGPDGPALVDRPPGA